MLCFRLVNPQQEDRMQVQAADATRVYPVEGSQEVVPANVNFGANAEATIPCFDLGGIEFMSKSDRAQLVMGLGTAMSRVGPGFIAIYAPALCDLGRAVLDEEQKYFSQSHEEKMKDFHNNNGQTGYSYPGFEIAVGADKPDNKETYFCGEDYDRWPEGRPEFEKVMTQIRNEGRHMSELIISLLLEHLEQPDVVCQGFIPGNKIRLAHYLSSVNAEPGAEWAKKHTDLNLLTLLFTASRSGLQMINRAGEWVSIIVPPGYVIVNAGDQLEAKTAGMILATPHRVINDDPGAADERYSFIYFNSWPDEHSLKPFGNCLDEAEKEGWDTSMCGDFNVLEHRLSRLIEIGLFLNPPKELVANLRSKGLLQKPTSAVKAQFPEMF